MNTPKEKKEVPVKSLGTLVKKRDFEKLVSEFKLLEKPEFESRKKEWFERREGDFPSEMDKILVLLLSYMKPAKKEEDDSQAQQFLNNQNGQNQNSPVQIGGMTIGAPIAPSMGSMGVNEENVFIEIKLEDINKEKVEIDPNAIKALNWLLENGADPNMKIAEGMTAMLMACTIPNEEPLLILQNNPYTWQNWELETFSNAGILKITDKQGHNPLAYALLTKNFYMADYLIDQLGYDVNEKFFRLNEKTILHVAAERFITEVEASPLQGIMYNLEKNTNEDIIVYLLSKGADPSLVDGNGQVPEELVPFMDDEMKELLPNATDAEVETWERVFNLLGNARKEMVKKKSSQLKMSF